MAVLRIKIFGLGGIGIPLTDYLCHFLATAHKEDEVYVTLFDGKAYREANRLRQDFDEYDNKAKVQARIQSQKWENLHIDHKPVYISADNAFLYIKNGDIVFLCVDNHPTRREVSDYCRTLDNVILISAGNEYTDGSAQLYRRRDGQDIDPSLTDHSPEIRNSTERHPATMSCEELEATSVPQLLFTNLAAAKCMIDIFWNEVELKQCNYNQVYFDINTGNVKVYKRELLKK